MSENKRPDTWALARSFARKRNLIRHNGDWYKWTGPKWVLVHKDVLQSEIAHWIAEQGLVPDTRIIKEIEFHLVSLRARGLIEFPAWDDTPVAQHILSCSNGLVDLETGKIYPHTPKYINLNSVDYPYDPEAKEPSAWLEFLNSIWADDPECVKALQRIFGYMLTPDTSMQRMFQLMGPPRSGKGTIGDVLAQVIGRDNVCAPSLQSISGDFALQPAIGRLIMLLSEARLDGRGTNRAAITDVLLRITGEDHFTINRKFREAWHGILPTRIIIQTNEPLELADDTGALLKRLIVLPMTETFAGREDLGLRECLSKERGSILKWAMDGWRMLREEGGMILQPASGKRVLNATRSAASPLTLFLDEKCVLDDCAECDKEQFYTTYRDWCKDNNGSLPMSKGKLTQKLETNYPIRAAKGRWIDKSSGLRAPPIYRGVRLVPIYSPTIPI